MRKMRDICIIHKKEDNAVGIYFREFAKWIGIAYFEFIYHDNDERLNSVLKRGKNRFDFILYINDKNGVLEKQFRRFAEVNISVIVNTIWLNAQNNIIRKDLLINLCNQAYQVLVQKTCCGDFRKVFKKLIDVYCDNDLLRKLFNNRYTIQLEGIRQKEYENQYQEWMTVILDMEKWKLYMSAEGADSMCGMEYFEYALINSQRKANEICNLLEARKAFDTRSLLERAENIYLLDESFYMVEGLKSKISRIEYMYKTMALSFDKICISDCTVDSCNSFNFYRLGKTYENGGYKQQALTMYMKSYKKNLLNFRAVFKLAVERIRRKDPIGAREKLLEILRILQVNVDGTVYYEVLKFLPPLELEYVCKCNILLGNIEAEFYDNHVNAADYYNIALDIPQHIDESIFLQEMYPVNSEREHVKKNLMSRLSSDSLRKKLAECESAGS